MSRQVAGVDSLVVVVIEAASNEGQVVSVIFSRQVPGVDSLIVAVIEAASNEEQVVSHLE